MDSSAVKAHKEQPVSGTTTIPPQLSFVFDSSQSIFNHTHTHTHTHIYIYIYIYIYAHIYTFTYNMSLYIDQEILPLWHN